MSETAARASIGSGALFKNLKKEKPSWPDLVGDITIKGAKYRLVAWRKEGAKGAYFSLSVSDFDEPSEAKPAATAKAVKASVADPFDL